MSIFYTPEFLEKLRENTKMSPRTVELINNPFRYHLDKVRACCHDGIIDLKMLFDGVSPSG